MKTIEELIDTAWDTLFESICKLDDNINDLVIEYKSTATGKTIRRSWLDREGRLKDE